MYYPRIATRTDCSSDLRRISKMIEETVYFTLTTAGDGTQMRDTETARRSLASRNTYPLFIGFEITYEQERPLPLQPESENSMRRWHQ